MIMIKVKYIGQKIDKKLRGNIRIKSNGVLYILNSSNDYTAELPEDFVNKNKDLFEILE